MVPPSGNQRAFLVLTLTPNTSSISLPSNNCNQSSEFGYAFFYSEYFICAHIRPVDLQYPTLFEARVSLQKIVRIMERIHSKIGIGSLISKQSTMQ